MQQTLPSLMDFAVKQYSDRIAIHDDNLQLTYSALNQVRLSVAKALIATGLKKGDCAAIWAPNIYEWIIAALGMQSIGVILVPLNNRLQGHEASNILIRSNVKILFTVPDLENGPLQTLLSSSLLSQLQNNIVFLRGNNTCQIGIEWSAFLSKSCGVEEDILNESVSAVQGDDLMDILFTSGTTGQPKGVLCNHYQNIKVFQTWADTVELKSQDSYLIVSPFFHSFGYKAGWLASIIKGCKIFPLITFDQNVILEMIERCRITVLPGAPAMYQLILSKPDLSKYDLSSLRLGVTGAAPISVQLIKDMWNILGFETVVTAYGMTESTGVISICRPGDNAQTISSTSGCAIEGVEIKCVDPSTLKEVDRGCDGEIWVRGYNVMQGYLNMPEATESMITHDDWMKTGDIGVMDNRGYLRITDRLTDMYIMNGENVYPAEVEKEILLLECVTQVAVVGVNKQAQGEVGIAFIVAKPQCVIDKVSIISHCRQRMAKYKVPYHLEVIEKLPTNAMGKVMKSQLKELAKDLVI